LSKAIKELKNLCSSGCSS